MSLGIAIKSPEGIVLAAESRVTITVLDEVTKQTQVMNFDNANKLLSFTNHNYVGAVTYGLGGINTPDGIRTAQSYMPEFESLLPTDKRLGIEDFAKKLSQFFTGQHKRHEALNANAGDMIFLIGGYNFPEAYGNLYEIRIPSRPTPLEHQKGSFGMQWGGQIDIVFRIIKGFALATGSVLEQVFVPDQNKAALLQQAMAQLELPIPFAVMPLQDCVDLAIALINTTIVMQRLSMGEKGCGGAIDVATITRSEGIKFIQRKTVVGER